MRENTNNEIDEVVHNNSIDGLRAISCLGIILMHIQANTEYEFDKCFVYDKFIPSLTWLVYLFIMISGFGMCAGYLEKFKTNTVDIENFYKKRYTKIMPFFTFVLLIGIFFENKISSLYDFAIEVLLLHGFLPNNDISLIGVSWTLGVIFVFYLIFPAYTIIVSDRKRAIAALIVSMFVSYICKTHFFSNYYVTESFTARHNFLFCLPLFVSGSILYLYKDELAFLCKKYRLIFLLICIFSTYVWYISYKEIDIFFYFKTIFFYMIWLAYCIGVKSRLLSCKLFRFLSNISMEMYLSQMIVFRLLDKLNLLYLFGKANIGGAFSFLSVFFLTILGLVLFIQFYKIIFNKIKLLVGKYIHIKL